MTQRILAFILLIIFLPLLALAALCILMLNGRPILFLQWRQGQGRIPFRIVKFRTMRNGMVTIPGHFLRRLGIDELPQLVNILRGEMAFLGPRPLTTEDIERLGWQGTNQNWRWNLLPGISGLAQLSGVCSARVSLYCDLKYFEKQSLALDIWILAKSVRHIMRRFYNRIKKKGDTR